MDEEEADLIQERPTPRSDEFADSGQTALFKLT